MTAIYHDEILVRGKPTSFLSLGKGLNESPKKILLIIPGNPGIVTYYKEFMQHLFDGVGDTHSVWALSHAAHSGTSGLTFWPNNQHVYNLDDQVQHKIAFITDYIPKGCEVTLVGHSIGSYIILKIIKAFESNTDIIIDRNYLLFPTFERMKTSPNGQALWPLIAYFRWLAIFLTSCLYFMPVMLKRMLVALYFKGKSTSECSVQATVELVHPKIVQNVLWMAYNELCFVKNADLETIDKHKDSIVFYYGVTDGWCPLSYRNELLAEIAGLNSNICEDIPHAFVLSKAKEVAMKIIDGVAS